MLSETTLSTCCSIWTLDVAVKLRGCVTQNSIAATAPMIMQMMMSGSCRLIACFASARFSLSSAGKELAGSKTVNESEDIALPTCGEPAAHMCPRTGRLHLNQF